MAAKSAGNGATRKTGANRVSSPAQQQADRRASNAALRVAPGAARSKTAATGGAGKRAR